MPVFSHKKARHRFYFYLQTALESTEPDLFHISNLSRDSLTHTQNHMCTLRCYFVSSTEKMRTIYSVRTTLSKRLQKDRAYDYEIGVCVWFALFSWRLIYVLKHGCVHDAHLSYTTRFGCENISKDEIRLQKTIWSIWLWPRTRFAFALALECEGNSKRWWFDHCPIFALHFIFSAFKVRALFSFLSSVEKSKAKIETSYNFSTNEHLLMRKQLIHSHARLYCEQIQIVDCSFLWWGEMWCQTEISGDKNIYVHTGSHYAADEATARSRECFVRAEALCTCFARLNAINSTATVYVDGSTSLNHCV